MMTEPVSMAQLMAALPHVLSAPKDRAPITQLCFRPDYNLRQFPESLTVDTAQGIVDERFGKSPWARLPDGSGDPRIQISILPQRVLDLVWRDRQNTLHPGDTMIADLDMSEANLPPGTLLQAGTARLKVSDLFNDGCVKWKARYGQDAKDWITLPDHPRFRLRGILCSVEESGQFRIGDCLTRLN